MKNVKVVVENKTYDLYDIQKWYVQIRSFLTILFFGKEKNQVAVKMRGQAGGRSVTEIVLKAENLFVEKIGIDEYQKRVDWIIEKKDNNNPTSLEIEWNSY